MAARAAADGGTAGADGGGTAGGNAKRGVATVPASVIVSAPFGCATAAGLGDGAR